jgi:putative ABC transport system substrate-binding protein
LKLGSATRWKLLSFEVRDVAEIDAAIEAATAAHAGALLPAGGLVFRHTRHIAELAAARRLPAFYNDGAQVGDAGLIHYGADLNVIWRRAAVFVDKIRVGPARRSTSRAADEV